MAILSSDITILDILRKRGELRVGELAELMGVTGTAIRQRLNRLLDQGYILRATIRSWLAGDAARAVGGASLAGGAE